MKKIWSPKWASSTQPRKQRKYRSNAPLHARRRFLSAHLSKELRERFGRRSVSLRKGDEVVVMKGGFRGFRGSVDSVDTATSRVYIEGAKRKKVDGSEVAVPIHASNVMITKLVLEDKMRQAVFERSAKARKPDAKEDRRHQMAGSRPRSTSIEETPSSTESAEEPKRLKKKPAESG